MIEIHHYYTINVGYMKNNDLSKIHVRTGYKIIYEDDIKTDKIRIYQYRTRCFVGLITKEQFEKCIAY